MRRPARRQKWARVSRQASCGTSIKPLRLELQTLYAAGSLTCFVFICHIRTLSSALSEAHGTGGVRAETETVKGRVRRGRRGAEAQRRRGAEAQRRRGAEAQRRRGAEAQRRRGAEAKRAQRRRRQRCTKGQRGRWRRTEEVQRRRGAEARLVREGGRKEDRVEWMEGGRQTKKGQERHRLSGQKRTEGRWGQAHLRGK